MYNVGENLLLEYKCTKQGINITWEYTVPCTPRYNDELERKYVTLYSKVRETMISEGFNQAWQPIFWDEVTKQVTN